ncbi:penicillin-binding protein 2 [Thermostaphylospora chromogena]|uniref:Penicillin-binding protein 2 n=1 Tax=Thermostaphylospora chromogena TaxID=35622 RepID=A0A1H1DQI0_9ACTN|nr:penicillin-binding protein 2 [Thermostaphylospora chromogena]
MRSRLVLVHLLVTCLFCVLLGRLWQVQVVDGDRYARAASEDHVRHVVIPAVRGRIVDSHGEPLVRNRTAMTVLVDRTVLTGLPDEGRAVLRRLAALLDMDPREIGDRVRLCSEKASQNCWAGSPYQPIPVAEAIDERVAFQIVERPDDFPGVIAEPQPVRDYPHGALAAHVLGYVAPGDEPSTGSASVGRDGLEATYEKELRGRPGSRELVVDSAGRVLRTLKERPATPGATLVTSIDTRIQRITETALERAVARARAQGRPADAGAAVVMESRTGRVVALASLPDYDPSVWVGGIAPDDYARLTRDDGGGPLLSRAIQGQWAPASTWKVVSTAAAVDAGYPLRGTYDCSSVYRVNGWDFRNYRGADHGRIDLRQALAVSCDTIFYRFAHEMWRKNPSGHPMQRMADAFGFGRATGVDLPGEAAGHLPRKGWERPGDAVNFSIGQGEVLVTPLQLARAYAALANGGTLFSPRIGKKIVGADGRVLREITPPVDGRLPVGRRTLAYIRQALAEVPKTGTAAAAFAGFPLDERPVAGKTGTAEVFGKQDTSWFASFDKRYTVVVMVAQGGGGGETAAPAARDIWSGIYRLKERR